MYILVFLQHISNPRRPTKLLGYVIIDIIYGIMCKKEVRIQIRSPKSIIAFANPINAQMISFTHYGAKLHGPKKPRLNRPLFYNDDLFIYYPPNLGGTTIRY